MRLKPGSTAWLLAHELRLAWRRLTERRGRGRAARIWLTLILPLILTLTVGVPLGLALNRFQVPVTPWSSALAALIALAAFTLMLSQTLASAVEALYQRADLDLLFSSPLKPGRVMTVRFLGVAVSVFAVFGFFITGPLLAIAVMGHPEWLGALVLLAAVALAASGTGLILASVLFRLIGPRRTRTIAQVLAAFIGASFFLLGQAQNILGRGGSRGAAATIARLAQDPRIEALPLDGVLRAARGEALPLLAAIGLGAGVFALANAWLGPRFAADAAAASGAGAGGRRRAGAVQRFAAGPFAATLRKELRLLVRDPMLITQVLMRVLYLLPLGFLLLRQAADQQAFLMPGSAAALVVFTGQVAGSLAWITVSAEDAPELLASAPAAVSAVRQAKMAAAAIPVAALLTPILIPLLVLSPITALAAAAGCTAVTAATSLLNVWWQRPGKRSEFRNRRRSSWFVAVAELLISVLIAAATGLLAAGLGWTVIPAAVAFALLMLLRRTDAQIAEALRAA